MTTTRGVVAGYDGSHYSMQALYWAMDEAEFRQLPLTVSHVWQWPYGEAGEVARLHLRKAADHVLWHGVECARASSSVTDVRGDLWEGSAGDRLVALSAEADLVVVGSRGLGGVSRLVIGSVAGHVAAHAHCPVIVVRGPGPLPVDLEPGPIVVGLSDDTTLDFAFREAEQRQIPLLAIHGGGPPPLFAGTALPPLLDLAPYQQALQESFDVWRSRYPTVTCQARIENTAAKNVLVEASHQARLLVVGRRRHGHLGLVTRAALHHACCPVAIVPALESKHGLC
ncbi:universal stress protein [Nonomuraea sp. NPDC046570]|uniref:universal stress protein n=1 Tax=Nonomuraea sp. NPDC046570 TaxID=3155255 RepID=UPI0033E3DBB3